MKTFAQLFKKYRLRAEFDTFASFSDALAKEGYFYEESIFSHWQKGTRLPTNRQLLLKIIEIFVERESIKTVDEANELLASAGLGYLTNAEKEKQSFKFFDTVPFLVPHELTDFIGRERIIKNIQEEIKRKKTIFICGQSGIGKTTLAIKLAHLLRKDYPDGVLWYRIDNIKIQDLFIAIAYALNEKMPESKNIEVKASFIRSLLARKRILLILDNVRKESNIHLLLPISDSSSLIILSKQKNIYLPSNIFTLPLEGFTNEEALSLFTIIFNKNYVLHNKNTFIKLAKFVGYLPLAIHLLAIQLKKSKKTPKEFLLTVEKENLSLQNIWYENKNLYLAINISYKNLSEQGKIVFISLGVFEGKDFTSEAIAYMNGLSINKSRNILEELYNASLIELSVYNRYRIHPMIKRFIAEKITNPYIIQILQVTVGLFGLLSVVWIVTQIFKLSLSYSEIFSYSYFLVSLWGSLCGFYITKKWGGIRSIVGKTFLMFSLGLFFQTIGQLLYNYYGLMWNSKIPYPSLGDIFYYTSIFIYGYAVILLAKVSDVKLNFNVIKNHTVATIVYILLVCFIYAILFQKYIFIWSNPLKIIDDLTNPLGDSLYTFFTLLIYLDLRKKRKNIMKHKTLFFVIALFIQFLADYGFVYQTNNGTWQIGDLDDYTYLLAYLLMSLSIVRFDLHLSKFFRYSLQ
ncbi:MAG TPA: NB-ARC domain-containing protein [Candidatus Saccharimonadales bacterium]|nr:NB-ARC domain-containing protein [Candidatus Saccharimonadales bacterium]